MVCQPLQLSPPLGSVTVIAGAFPDLVMVSQRNGKELTFNVPPNDPELGEYTVALRHLMYRAFQPVRRITVEAINGEDAGESQYLDGLRDWFEVHRDHRQVRLHRKLQ